MPQLDFATFPSQILWLAICFMATYFFVLRYALPQISKVFQSRQDRIASDLDEAERLKQEAEEMETSYKTSAEETRSKANAIIAEATAEAEKEAEARYHTLDEDLSNTLAEAEKRMQDARQKAVKALLPVSQELAALTVEKVADMTISDKDSGAVVSELLKEKVS